MLSRGRLVFSSTVLTVAAIVDYAHNAQLGVSPLLAGAMTLMLLSYSVKS